MAKYSIHIWRCICGKCSTEWGVWHAETDLDQDGKPELLVIAMQNGKMTFTVYRVVDGEVKADATVNATDGIGTALPEADYGFTQECFGKEDDAGMDSMFCILCIRNRMQVTELRLQSSA